MARSVKTGPRDPWRCSVHIDLTPDQRAFRDEMRTYFEKMMTPELTDEIAGSDEIRKAYLGHTEAE